MTSEVACRRVEAGHDARASRISFSQTACRRHRHRDSISGNRIQPRTRQDENGRDDKLVAFGTAGTSHFAPRRIAACHDDYVLRLLTDQRGCSVSEMAIHSHVFQTAIRRRLLRLM